RQRSERAFGAERRVAVGMTPEEEACKRALRDRSRYVTDLRQAVQPKLTNANEIFLSERRPRRNVRKKCQGTGREAAADGPRKRGSIRPDVRVELGAQTSELLMNLDRAARAAPFVEHVHGSCSEAFLSSRIVGRAPTKEQRDGHQRNR